MADVQLSRGFTRIVHGLYEAAISTHFSATHQRILHCLIRLTYGWRRYSVRISQGDLASACGIPLGGRFVDALRDLVEQEVVIEMENASGRRAAVYMVNKYPSKWGPKYRRSDGEESALFRVPPPSGDEDAAERRLTEIGQAIEAAESQQTDWKQSGNEPIDRLDSVGSPDCI